MRVCCNLKAIKIIPAILYCLRGKWKLVEHWEDGEQSGARFCVKKKLDDFLPVHYEESGQEY
jgi:hypothetical protein